MILFPCTPTRKTKQNMQPYVADEWEREQLKKEDVGWTSSNSQEKNNNQRDKKENHLHVLIGVLRK